ncbi:plasminogen receptor (KT) [Cygnus olor]|uniref:plasminogen receptor (KT) n=1 Tax=Cygnus olor TaxID=8869 RepID=UPI001ADE5DF9|nr:plasminogen receptor (KT) [Cygnus olor]
MGFVFSKSMNENLKAQREFMLMNSRLQPIHHSPGSHNFLEVCVNELQRSTAQACHMALLNAFNVVECIRGGSKSQGMYIGVFIVMSLALLLNKARSASAVHDKSSRRKGSISSEAENILDTQSALLEPPKGPLTFEDLEKIRRSQSKFFIEK